MSCDGVREDSRWIKARDRWIGDYDELTADEAFAIRMLAICEMYHVERLHGAQYDDGAGELAP